MSSAKRGIGDVTAKSATICIIRVHVGIVGFRRSPIVDVLAEFRIATGTAKLLIGNVTN